DLSQLHLRRDAKVAFARSRLSLEDVVLRFELRDLLAKIECAPLKCGKLRSSGPRRLTLRKEYFHSHPRCLTKEDTRCVGPLVRRDRLLDGLPLRDWNRLHRPGPEREERLRLAQCRRLSRFRSAGRYHG